MVAEAEPTVAEVAMVVVATAAGKEEVATAAGKEEAKVEAPAAG
jgi:hypothetical protein